MKKQIFYPVLLLCMLILSSCVEFERQTLIYKYDEKTDTLKMFQIYTGISGSDALFTISDKEKNELNSVFKGERTFFFSNWLYAYNRKQLAGFIADPNSKKIKKYFIPLLKLIVDNTKITNGEFYYSRGKKLTAYQTATVRNITEIINEFNKIINSNLIKDFVSDKKFQYKASASMLLDSCKDSYKWVSIDGNSIRIKSPLAKSDFMKIKNDYNDGLIKSLAALQKGNNVPAVQSFMLLTSILQNEIVLNYSNQTAMLTVGTSEDNITTLNMHISNNYSFNLIDYVMGKYSIQKNMVIKKKTSAFFGN